MHITPWLGNDEQDYLESRIKLQLELEQPKPIADDELEQAADLLANFKTHWERLEGDDEGRRELVKLIVERIYVADEQIKVVTLRSNYHLILGHKTNGPTPVEVDPFLYQNGSDESFTHAHNSACLRAGHHEGRAEPQR